MSRVASAPVIGAAARRGLSAAMRSTGIDVLDFEADVRKKAGLGIEHPILQVAVYDGVESENKIIELP